MISWVADHRKHHAFSDQEGDPHSPHVGHERRLARRPQRARPRARRLAVRPRPARSQATATRRDLIDDPIVRSSTAPSSSGRSAASALAFGLGWRSAAPSTPALTGLLWGGAVRMLVLHHVTYSINSLCHFFGRQRFDTGDESRNLAVAGASLARASRGTTTTTRSRPPRRTACVAGRSTSRPR